LACSHLPHLGCLLSPGRALVRRIASSDRGGPTAIVTRAASIAMLFSGSSPSSFSLLGAVAYHGIGQSCYIGWWMSRLSEQITRKSARALAVGDAQAGTNTHEYCRQCCTASQLGNPTGRFERRPIILYFLLRASPAPFVGGKEILGGFSVRPRGQPRCPAAPLSTHLVSKEEILPSRQARGKTSRSAVMWQAAEVEYNCIVRDPLFV
jgi:hypothetical protein